MKVPDKNGDIADIALGYDDLESYDKMNWVNIGNICGRVINLIRDATFKIDGETYHLTKNRGKHSNHSGLEPFGKVTLHKLFGKETSTQIDKGV